MFAHQVIETITTAISELSAMERNKHQDALLDHAKLMLGIIPSAQKFHLEDGDEAMDLFPSFVGKPIFSDPDLFKLPYNNIWIDAKVSRETEPGTVPITKEGVSIKAITSTLWLTNFASYAVSLKKWYCAPYSIVVAVGGFNYGSNAEDFESYASEGRGFGDPDFIRRLKEKSLGTGGNTFPLIDRAYEDVSDQIIATVKEYSFNLTLAQATILLLNCKNIGTVVHCPDEALNKARRKHKKVELFSYKTLVLKCPPKVQTAKSSEEQGGHNRIHLCRGHFKVRRTGVYWWQPHLRGQNKEGVVLKDYSIRVNKE